MTQAVILVGFMGAGKTTVGRALAERLRWRFTDLDDLIRERDGRSIPDIFRDSGEAYFRRVETDCLRDALKCQMSAFADTRHLPPDTGLVLALGGGAIVQPQNIALVSESRFPVIFLDAPVEELLRRCALEEGARPLFADANQFRQLYEARRGSYMAAGVRIDTASLSPEQVAGEIVRRFDLRGHT